MAVPRINPNPHSKAYAIVPAGTRLEYLHMAGRPDLRAEPHGWKMPIPVKVAIRIIK
jgi:hypothetical protein